jgi:uncharacterized membrane protein
MQPTANQPRNSLWLILSLFIGFRLMMLMAWPAETLTQYGDYQYYYNLAALSDMGRLPFLDYWSEHFPTFPFLSVALYQLSGGAFKNYALLLSLTMLVFEVATLALLYRMASDTRGESQATWMSGVYVALFIPVFIWLGTFEAMTAFFVLLTLFALRRGQPWLSGIAIGLGAMTKVLPLMLLATIWRTRGWRAALVSGLLALLVCLVVLGPLLILSPDYTLASLQSQVSKSSWQTVWALLDGNTVNTGIFGPVADHFDPVKARTQLCNPSRVPAWLTLIPFALLGLFIFTRPVLRDAEDPFIFAALTFTIFFLWAKGWSPQWQMFLVPLLLLSLPVRRAVLFVLVLGFINLLEWPLLLSRGLTELLPLTIVARTIVLVLLGWELYQQMTRLPQPTGAANG